MSLIVKMRKQNAIYWPPAAPDAYGRPAAGALVELVLHSVDPTLLAGDGVALVAGGYLDFHDSLPLVFSDGGFLTLGMDEDTLIFGPPVGNFRVRWDDQVKEFLDASGAVRMSEAVVYVSQLPDGSEVVVGGYLWRGNRASLKNEKDPRANGANEVRRVDNIPNLKASEFLRVCYL